MSTKFTLLRLLLILTILASGFAPFSSGTSVALAQADTPELMALELLNRMSPEERVGQLFLTTFDGRDVGAESQIYDLIVNYHIGGVALRADNNNFTGPDDTLSETYALIAELQSSTWEPEQPSEADTVETTGASGNYIPLFIGISQEGGGYPYDQILSGVTQLPSPMAIGATWDTSLAEQAGSVLGRELSALGFNLLLGPSLDVLETLHADSSDDLGTRTFGGDQFWVGEMGRSYIEGIHNGSQNRIAVISKYFPGRGGSDRPMDEEVATVRKSLEQLKQIELAPFFRVTEAGSAEGTTTDGLLVSHIRYQGFQGNIRAATRPVSFDQAALDQIMGLEPLAQWRSSGGVIVSDNLGSQAVRRFYSLSDQAFDARLVARNAFVAGNDLLYVDDMVSTGDPDAYTTLIRTIESFVQKYHEDTAFAQRVDSAVLRLLTLKFRIYPEFAPDQVMPIEEILSTVGTSNQVTFQIAQDAATLISPDASELATTMPGPPDSSDQIVFLTDTLEGRQCATCSIQSAMPVDALETTVERLYGPQGSQEVLPYKLSSYSFDQVSSLLEGMAPNDPDIALMEEDLRATDWIVLSMLNLSSNRPSSDAVRRLLAERPDLIRGKRVVAFSFGAPYYLDATDITQLSAYFGLYSTSPAFIDLAARLLFKEATATGALPVSVPGIGYDLIVATSPDPNQVIPLMLDLYDSPEAIVSPTPTEELEITVEPTAIPTFNVGDSLPLRTGVIYDHNGNVVPDGTVVRFTFTLGADASTMQQTEVVTVNGIGRTSYRIQTAGLLEVRAMSDPAMTSDLLRLDVTNGVGAPVSVIEPTNAPTPTDTPPVPTPTVTVSPTPTATAEPPAVPPTSGTGEWLFSMAMIWVGAGGVFWVGSQRFSLRWGVRFALLSLTGGMLAYLVYMAVAESQPSGWSERGWMAGLLVSILLGIAIGWASGWFWQLLNKRSRQNDMRRINSSK
jgi:beta-N-acetylhexosaminidase